MGNVYFDTQPASLMFQHGLTDFFSIGRAFEFLAFVIQVSTFCQTDADLDSTFGEVDVQWYQRESLLLGAFGKFTKFPLMNQQLTSPFRLVIHQVGLRVLVNVGTDEPQLSITNARIRFFDRNLRIADTLNFTANQRDSAFQFVNDVVLVSRLAIGTDMP